jgi:hypothetical protein
MRQIWMFPRNKRRMMPLDTALILRAMVVASELGTTWGGDQGQQNQFSRLLDEYGLKSGGDQRDKNPGGSRTYEAQMRSLGLLYKDSRDGSLKLTQAGQDLVELIEPSKTFEYQILKFQYPSSYSLGRNVDIDRKIKIRPFLFLLKLANDPILNGLSDKDMVVPVVYGRNEQSYEICKKLILKLRAEGVESVIPDDASIRTAKTQNNSYAQRIEDIGNIANTFKNVLQGSGIVNLRDIEGQVRVFPRIDIKARIAEIESIPYVDFIGLSEEQATLKFGNRLGSLKDTRRSFMPTKNPELFTKSALIFQKFLDEVDLPVTQTEVDEFVIRMEKEFQLSREIIIKALEPILANSTHYAGARLIELSKGGLASAEAFEKNVQKIFEVDFGYHAEWTGRTHRSQTGGFMDVFVVEIERNVCGILDTKSMKSYDLPHQDVSKAITTYVDAASELYGARGNLELKFVAYISHLIGTGASTRALDLYNAKKVPVSLISAYGLNSLRDDKAYQRNAVAVTNRLSKESVNLIL